MRRLKSKLTAEFIGTFILVFAGTGAIVIDSITGAISHVGIALTFGFVVTALIYSFSHISGAHFNPAVTISFAIMKEFDKKDVLPYILAQLLGAILASISLYYLFIDNVSSVKDISYLGATLPKYSSSQSFILEFILTFILMLVISSSAVHAKATKSFAGLAIGFTVALEAMFAGPICGASMNPARSIAPAIVSGNIDHLWIYIIATTLGAISSIYIYNIINK
jgi:aquaporin Z